jgi:hypothetical protein
MFACCECCILSGRGLCNGLITRPEESYRLWHIVCDQETSKTRRLKPAIGLWKIQSQWVVTPGKQKTTMFCWVLRLCCSICCTRFFLDSQSQNGWATYWAVSCSMVKLQTIVPDICCFFVIKIGMESGHNLLIYKLCMPMQRLI